MQTPVYVVAMLVLVGCTDSSRWAALKAHELPKTAPPLCEKIAKSTRAPPSAIPGYNSMGYIEVVWACDSDVESVAAFYKERWGREHNLVERKSPEGIVLVGHGPVTVDVRVSTEARAVYGGPTALPKKPPRARSFVSAAVVAH